MYFFARRWWYSRVYRVSSAWINAHVRTTENMRLAASCTGNARFLSYYPRLHSLGTIVQYGIVKKRALNSPNA